MTKKQTRSILWLALSAILILVDQLSKQWAQKVLAPQGAMDLIDGFIGFRYAENTGAAFSAFSGTTAILSIFSLIVCLIIAIYILSHSEMSAWLLTPLSMILAGGVGNLIDRMVRGYVVDFFEFHFVKFAIFNVADIFITVGAALLLIALLCGGEKSGRMDG